MKKKHKGKGVFDACVARSDNDDSNFALVGTSRVLTDGSTRVLTDV